MEIPETEAVKETKLTPSQELNEDYYLVYNELNKGDFGLGNDGLVSCFDISEKTHLLSFCINETVYIKKYKKIEPDNLEKVITYENTPASIIKFISAKGTKKIGVLVADKTSLTLLNIYKKKKEQIFTLEDEYDPIVDIFAYEGENEPIVFIKTKSRRVLFLDVFNKCVKEIEELQNINLFTILSDTQILFIKKGDDLLHFYNFAENSDETVKISSCNSFILTPFYGGLVLVGYQLLNGIEYQSDLKFDVISCEQKKITETLLFVDFYSDPTPEDYSEDDYYYSAHIGQPILTISHKSHVESILHTKEDEWLTYTPETLFGGVGERVFLKWTNASIDVSEDTPLYGCFLVDLDDLLVKFYTLYVGEYESRYRFEYDDYKHYEEEPIMYVDYKKQMKPLVCKKDDQSADSWELDMTCVDKDYLKEMYPDSSIIDCVYENGIVAMLYKEYCKLNSGKIFEGKFTCFKLMCSDIYQYIILGGNGFIRVVNLLTDEDNTISFNSTCEEILGTHETFPSILVKSREQVATFNIISLEGSLFFSWESEEINPMFAIRSWFNRTIKAEPNVVWLKDGNLSNYPFDSDNIISYDLPKDPITMFQVLDDVVVIIENKAVYTYNRIDSEGEYKKFNDDELDGELIFAHNSSLPLLAFAKKGSELIYLRTFDKEGNMKKVVFGDERKPSFTADQPVYSMCFEYEMFSYEPVMLNCCSDNSCYKLEIDKLPTLYPALLDFEEEEDATQIESNSLVCIADPDSVIDTKLCHSVFNNYIAVITYEAVKLYKLDGAQIIPVTIIDEKNVYFGTFVENEKDTYFAYVSENNEVVVIDTKGVIIYRRLIELTIRDFVANPLDFPTLYIEFEGENNEEEEEELFKVGSINIITEEFRALSDNGYFEETFASPLLVRKFSAFGNGMIAFIDEYNTIKMITKFGISDVGNFNIFEDLFTISKKYVMACGTVFSGDYGEEEDEEDNGGSIVDKQLFSIMDCDTIISSFYFSNSENSFIVPCNEMNLIFIYDPDQNKIKIITLNNENKPSVKIFANVDDKMPYIVSDIHLVCFDGNLWAIGLNEEGVLLAADIHYKVEEKEEVPEEIDMEILNRIKVEKEPTPVKSVKPTKPIENVLREKYECTINTSTSVPRFESYTFQTKEVTHTQPVTKIKRTRFGK